jgi:hypothetical protein
MTEVVLNVETITNVKKDGELWFVYVGDHRLGRGCRDEHAAEALQRWFCSAQQDIVDWVAAMIDGAFAETGK